MTEWGARTQRDWAILYQAHGLAVFPCRKDKTPLTRHGSLDATRDRVQIEQWWRQWPEASIGIATGKTWNLVVIDIDPEHGGSKDELEKVLGGIALRTTPVVQTGGGGWHLYYTIPEDIDEIPNSVSQIAPGIDIRGKGGYVIAPRSEHPSGNKYEWDIAAELEDTPIAELPGAFRPWLTDQRNAPSERCSKVEALASASETISESIRNITLFKRACQLRSNGFDYDEILAAMTVMNAKRCVPPLDMREVEQLTQSACQYEPGEALQPVEELEQEEQANAWQARNATQDFSTHGQTHNPLLRERIHAAIRVDIRRIVQRGVGLESIYFVDLGQGLQRLGTPYQFCSRAVWEQLLLCNNLPNELRKWPKERWSDFRMLLQSYAIQEQEQEVETQATILLDALRTYLDDAAEPAEEDEHRGYLVAGEAQYWNNQYWISLARFRRDPSGEVIKNMSLQEIAYQLRQLGWTKKITTLRYQGRLYTRNLWQGTLVAGIPDDE